jgi:hypothetical protein
MELNSTKSNPVLTLGATLINLKNSVLSERDKKYESYHLKVQSRQTHGERKWISVCQRVGGEGIETDCKQIQ